MTTTTTPFDPSVITRGYTNSQWIQKEDWYTQQLDKIKISDSPSTADIQQAAVQIDALLSIARLDYAFVNQRYDVHSMQLKIEEKRQFVELKLQPPAQFAGMKLTVDDMKGVVASVLSTNHWDNTNFTLYQLVQMSSTRNIFMEAVIKILQDKKDLLITHSGMLKIENSVVSMQPNIPGSYIPKDSGY